LVVSFHIIFTIFLAKNYVYIFEFVKVMLKVLSVPFFSDTMYNAHVAWKPKLSHKTSVYKHLTTSTK